MNLYHFSEDPTISTFRPRVPRSNPSHPPLVWAIDEEHAPHYFFPRDCPRIAYWATASTSSNDKERFFSHTSAAKIIAVESNWLSRIRETKLYVYQLPGETFECIDETAGYYVSHQEVRPLTVEPVGDLLQRLVEAKIELRLTPSLWKLYYALASSTVSFSMIRMSHAQPE
ncbi:DUF6886 family protein [Thermoflavimicrobium dichotomicum]|uniref:Uncharacterized protein n=1 Tax=Thermoflavimicrobium dichotomicum TaxID=46223 RepID=A0A1I3P2Y0_9BACL|nr:DUF6886 family protein [Thermoflavimicrobium dichotomicum]SFJ15801.1 hypothetical protein SAMN05421852_10568 [Thermoflavimicrobium dichotomicum]